MLLLHMLTAELLVGIDNPIKNASAPNRKRQSQKGRLIQTKLIIETQYIEAMASQYD